MHTPVRNESKQTTAQFPLWHLPLHCPSTRWRNFWGIILIPGPFRIQSHNQFWIILDLFYFIRNGAVWSCASIISACAVSFTLILLRDWHEWWVIQDWVSWGCLSMPESVRRPGPGGLPASLSGITRCLSIPKRIRPRSKTVRNLVLMINLSRRLT